MLLDIITGRKLVYFGAPWCAPCKVVKPMLEDFESDIEIVRVDVDKDFEISEHFGVSGLPTILILQDGEIQGALTVSMDKEQIKDLIYGTAK